MLQLFSKLILAASVLASPSVVEAASCRNFVREARAAIASHVDALRRLEREAADRLAGLDTRTFDRLLDAARKTTAMIADPEALKDEDGPRPCRNETQPIRHLCADAAQMLVDVLEKHAAGPSPAYDKPKYTAAMTQCEKVMDLRPLKSAIRTTD